MRIVTVRRIAQGFFLLLFFWFCWVTTLGDRWWELSGWPVNWLLQLDPLVGLSTVLATRTLYAGLVWGAVTVVLTLVLGRFFCGWICPFGTLQQAAGYLSGRGRKLSGKIRVNRYRPLQGIKYAILVFLLAAAAADLIPHLLGLAAAGPVTFIVLVAVFSVFVWVALRVRWIERRSTAVFCAIFLAALAAAALFPVSGPWLHAASVQTGLLDPIPLAHRGVNLTLLPLFRGDLAGAAAEHRRYADAWLIGVLFWGALFGALWIPRFYCRFVCPLGALFAVVGRFAPWRIGKKEAKCRSCLRCESHCEGGCTPSAKIRTAECVLCMNCMDRCGSGNIGYRPRASAGGETGTVDLSRRAFSVALVSGLVIVPTVRLDGATGANWIAGRVRPPGALDEDRFLRRCIKCGQCMRVCPTNVIHPAVFQAGIEGFWTPVLNFRIGTSGCQVNCVACGNVCPTAAIRPLSLEERRGRGRWAEKGPIRIGTAFVDRGRCLPWAMSRPCIVCQENCPVSPKAILVTEQFQALPYGGATVVQAGDTYVEGDFSEAAAEARPYGSGDYYCLISDSAPRRIASFGASRLQIAPEDPWPEPPPTGSKVSIAVHLQLPHVDPARCIGCGICEHECPVQGLRAIRVTAENESRDPAHALITKTI